MKILIIDTVSYDRAPYLKYYENACKECKVDYDLFLWDRFNNGGLKKQGNCYTFHKICPLGNGKLRKLLPMIFYRNNLLKTLKSNNYTHLILIDTLASVMISNYVLKHYENKYIMDIRDYTYERFGKYRSLVNKLISRSYFSTVSSEGFYRFLNKNEKIILNHNISNTSEITQKTTLKEKIVNKQKIVIGFVGSVRYEKENLSLIKALKNNPNYELFYCGQIVNGCNIDKKARDLGADNIKFSGAFDNKQKGKIYGCIDIINSLYGNDSLEVTTAVPNRYYDALLFKKPIIASKGTYLGELVQENHLGITVDIFRDDVALILENFLDRFESPSFVDSCNEELQRVLKEQQSYYLRIKQFIET